MRHIVLSITIAALMTASTPHAFSQGGGRNAVSDATSNLNLQRLWEEEKLARDVYLQLATTTGLQVFRNISQSENQHMQAVSRLASGSGGSDVPGTFSSLEFQQLYQALTTSGTASLADALKVGAKIEEMDIADLQRLIASTNDQLTQQVLGQLLRASENHLRAFTGQLQSGGVVYAPVILPQEEYNRILASAESNGPPQRGGRNNGRSQGRGRHGR